MKKIKQLSILLIICLCMVVSRVSAETYDFPAYFKTTSDTISSIPASKGNSYGITIHHQYTSNGYAQFCLNQGHNYVGGAGYRYMKTYTNQGYACGLLKMKEDGKDTILNKLKSLNGANLDSSLTLAEYSTIQYYLWQYNSNSTCNDLTSKEVSTGTNYSISIGDMDSSKFTLQENYYVSDAIKVDYNGTGAYSITLTGANGAFISTKSSGATQGITSSTADTLYLYIPVGSNNYNNIKLMLKTPEYVYAKKYNYKAEVYEYAHHNAGCSSANGAASTAPSGTYACGPNDTYAYDSYNQFPGKGYQHLALVYYNETSTDLKKTVNDDITFNYEPTGSIEITKISSNNQKPIQGVKFKLYNKDSKTEAKYANGTAIGELTTDTNGKITINNLLFGDYVLKEVASAEGYLTNEKVYPIQIKDTSVIQIKVTNNPVLTKISKKDITNEKELVGAHIVITDESDNIRAEYDSTEEPYEFYLGPGKYKLKETVAPEGYDLVETVFEFEILKNGNVKLLSTESDYFKTDKNEIILYNKVTEVPVPDTFKTNIILSIIGIGLSIAGAIIVLITLRKRKINEI